MNDNTRPTLELVTRDERDIRDIERAAAILRDGGLVVIPTETVYGLAADACNADAVKRIFEAKGRPSDNPLIVHISRFEQLGALVREVPESAKKLADAFWPGPLTIILPKSDRVPDVTSGGLDTVAVRMPSHPAARAIIDRSVPLAAPSANISGLPSPAKYEYVRDDMLGRVDAICDGGECAIGVESTVITLAAGTPTVLRPGGITPAQLERVLGRVAVSPSALKPLAAGETAASPGMKYKHYAPKAAVTVVAGDPDAFAAFVNDSDCDGVMCFEGEENRFPGKTVVTFGDADDPFSQARRLYDALRELDALGLRKVFCRDVNTAGVGLAVANRLYRASAFRRVYAGRPPIVGLTGPTGAGKGYVGAVLAEAGCRVIDTDAISRELTRPGSPFLTTLAQAFGAQILRDGALDRAKLAAIAFSDPAQQKKLNALSHPAILARAKAEADAAIADGAPAAVIDAPLLFESGADKMCDCIIAVTAPEALRLQRIMARDGLTREQALARMSAQQPDDFYTSRADLTVVSDDGSDVRRQLEPFFRRYIPS